MGRTKLALTILVVLCLTVATWAFIDLGISKPLGAEKNPSPKSMGYAGSVSCRECHEKFYQLWSTSRHGLAMQPYTPDFAKKNLTPQPKEVKMVSPPTGRTLPAKPAGFWKRDPRAKRNTRSSMFSVERTSTTFWPLSRGDDSRPFPLPMTSRKRSGSTRPPAASATSRE